MKKEITTKISKKLGVEENHININKEVKAVIINFGDERGDIIVENDNFGTRRKYADFTQGKKKAGLNPLQIVFCGLDMATDNDRYIGKDDQVHFLKELVYQNIKDDFESFLVCVKPLTEGEN